MDKAKAMELIEQIQQNMAKKIIGKEEVISYLLTALLSKGHVLIEDLPGVGKTTLIASLAKTTGCDIQRIQFTPDVTPSEITGYSYFNMHTGEKLFQEGAIVHQMILADEINRTSPKTQSALLEAMQEGRLTVEGNTYELPEPFFVMATQNPIDMAGTYPLPEAQLDRFMMCISVGYPSKSEEVSILRRNQNPIENKEPNEVCTAEELLELQHLAAEVTCSDGILNYITRLTEQTRTHSDLTLGISPRGAIALMHASMAWAFIQRRAYVLPDDVQKMALPVFRHRLILNRNFSSQHQTTEEIIEQLIKQTPIPDVTGTQEK